MNDVESLRALMEADRWLERLRGQRTHLAERDALRELEEHLRVQLETLRRVEGELAPVRAAAETAAVESARLQLRHGSLGANLRASTAGARELQSVQGELEHVREALEVNEDLELELLEALDPLERAVSELREAARPDLERRAVLRESVTALEASLADELNVREGERVERTRDVAPALLERYERARTRAGTSGAAQVADGRCDGCRLALAPADVDRWRHAAAGSFFECPECGRLLLPG